MTAARTKLNDAIDKHLQWERDSPDTGWFDVRYFTLLYATHLKIGGRDRVRLQKSVADRLAELTRAKVTESWLDVNMGGRPSTNPTRAQLFRLKTRR
jgi:hypothetical protein